MAEAKTLIDFWHDSVKEVSNKNLPFSLWLEKCLEWSTAKWLEQKRFYIQSYKWAYGCPASERQKGQLESIDELLEELQK